jgi:hypothetical protein
MSYLTFDTISRALQGQEDAGAVLRIPGGMGEGRAEARPAIAVHRPGQASSLRPLRRSQSVIRRKFSTLSSVRVEASWT